ncbi:MAG: GTP-binding protein [Candidatus Helarchaeota archaeon]|nr:GTP-binding protein [Candidatus Helarchaeota archaeon]
MSEIIEKKVILVGIDNAGKTTILNTMKKEQDSAVYDLKPTKGVNIEEFKTIEAFSTKETSVIVWDFGGQIQYRMQYLQEAEKYFVEIDRVIYVIDIQDKNRFEETFDYLMEILKLIRGFNKDESKIDVMVFLHKLDPRLVNDPQYKERSKYLQEKIKNIFKLYKFKLTVFETSIFTVFQKIEVI